MKSLTEVYDRTVREPKTVIPRKPVLKGKLQMTSEPKRQKDQKDK